MTGAVQIRCTEISSSGAAVSKKLNRPLVPCLLVVFCTPEKRTAGKKDKGYNDGLGNFSHVGIYLGEPHGVIHSTTGGVQWGKYPDKRWNYCSLLAMLEYGCKNLDNEISDDIIKQLDIIQSAVTNIERMLKNL